MQRKRRSAADWCEVLASFKASHLSPAEFCRANQIGIKSFYRARIKYGSTTKSVASSSSGFVKVSCADRSLSLVPPATTGIEVILPHVRLRLDTGVSPAWVADLLKSLAA